MSVYRKLCCASGCMSRHTLVKILKLYVCIRVPFFIILTLGKSSPRLCLTSSQQSLLKSGAENRTTIRCTVVTRHAEMPET